MLFHYLSLESFLFCLRNSVFVAFLLDSGFCFSDLLSYRKFFDIKCQREKSLLKKVSTSIRFNSSLDKSVLGSFI